MSLNFDVMKKVNAEVNAGVAFVGDVEQWKEADRWEDGMETGMEDCDGYAIAKLRQLLSLGYPREDLKLGLCYVETGEYHAVLVATCDGADWVLDNRHPHPTQWDDLPYRWDRFYLFGERRWRAAV